MSLRLETPMPALDTPRRPDWGRLSELRRQWGREFRPAFVVLQGEDGSEPWVGLARWEHSGAVLKVIPQAGELCGPIVAIDYPREEINRVEWLAFTPCSSGDGCLEMHDPNVEGFRCGRCIVGANSFLRREVCCG